MTVPPSHLVAGPDEPYRSRYTYANGAVYEGEYKEVRSQMPANSGVSCQLPLRCAQDAKDGKGRLICDGIGTLAEARRATREESTRSP